jgi:uncharacterized tellurite resistance protein B-like protein
MLERIQKAFRRVNESDADQQQRKATMDLVVWMMYADSAITLPESDAVDRIVEELSGDDTALPLEQYVGSSTAKVRNALGDEEASEQLLTDIHERLGTPEMRQRAYDACRDLARADGHMADEEEAFLSTVRARFGIQASS